MVTKTKQKEVSKDHKKNYEKEKKNNLRFLANRKFLTYFSVIAFLVLMTLGNWLFHQCVAFLSQPLFDFTVKRAHVSYGQTIFYYPLLRYPLFYLLLFLGIVALIGYFDFKLYTSFRPLEDDLTQGTMHFTPEEDMEKEYEIVPVHIFAEDEDFYDGMPGYPVGRKPQTPEEKEKGIFHYYVDTSDSNSATLAGTRQGKGIYFIDPFIDILTRARLIADRASFVMTATKGDEPRKWYKTLKRRGYNVRICNTVNQYFSDPIPTLAVFNNYYRHYKRLKQKADKARQQEDKASRIKYNVLAEQQLANAEKAINQAAFLYFKEVNEGKDGGFWTKACRNLFISTGLALADQEFEQNEKMKVNPYTIYTVVNDMMSKHIKEGSHDFLNQFAKDKKDLQRLLAEYEDKSYLDVFFSEMPRNHPAKRYFDAIKASAPAQVTLGNIVTHFDGDLQQFLMSANAKMTAYDDGFDLESIGFDRERPTAVFVVLSDADSSNNAVGVNYIDQIYQVLLNRCNLEDDSACYRAVHFIYEEGGNLGVAISDLARKWTSGASRKLFQHLVLQDTEQLTSLYDEQTKEIILGNTANLVYIRTGSKATNEYISGRLGTRSNYSKTRHKDPTSISSSETESSERIDLLASFELERTRTGESVVLRINKHTDLKGNPIYQYPILNSQENDSNMIPFYEFRKLDKVSWEEIPVNNQFVEMELEDLDWSLMPQKEKSDKPAVVQKEVSPIETYKKPVPKKEGTQLSLLSLEELIQLEKNNGKEERRKKEGKAKVLERLYSVEERKRSVKEYYSNEQVEEIQKIMARFFVGQKEVLQELKQILENGQVQSLCTFLLSTSEERMINRYIQQFREWKEIAYE